MKKTSETEVQKMEEDSYLQGKEERVLNYTKRSKQVECFRTWWSPPLFKLQDPMHYVQHYPVNSQSQLETRAFGSYPREHIGRDFRHRLWWILQNENENIQLILSYKVKHLSIDVSLLNMPSIFLFRDVFFQVFRWSTFGRVWQRGN